MRLASQEVGRYDLRPTSCSTNNLLRQAFPLASVHTYAAALLSNLLLRETSNLSPTWYGRMYGRGGAGNISKARQGSEKAAADAEVHLAPAAATTTPGPAPSSNTGQDYVHMGRGGAGNCYQPAALGRVGTFTQPVDATAMPTAATPQVSTPWHPEGQEIPLARTGRGGAGNFVWKSGASARQVNEAEERKRESVRQCVERAVEAGLAKPPGVLLGREEVGKAVFCPTPFQDE